MKKFIYLLIIGFVLTIPYSVKALTGADINLDCPAKVVPGKDFICTLTGTSTSSGNEGVSGVDLKITTGEGVTLKSIEKKGDWPITDDSNGQISYGTDEVKKGNFEIATITFTLADSAAEGTQVEINIEDIELIDNEDKSVPLDNKKYSVIASNDANVPDATDGQSAIAPGNEKTTNNPNTGIATWVTTLVIGCIGLGSAYILKFKNRIN